MPLDTYKAKRDFETTPEPTGGQPSDPDRLRFVIQEHAATAHHYDFRLELDGVLLSWAVPKGPSLDPKDKRLAMRTEDHPIDYASFEGAIPKGEYGAGTVIVWDNGTWHPQDPPGSKGAKTAQEALAAGELKFVLEGHKLRGKWVLVRLKPRGNEKRESWLLIKERDDEVVEGGPSIVEREPRSVLSDRTLDQVRDEEASAAEHAESPPAADPPSAAATPAEASATASAATTDAGSGAVAAPMPDPADLSFELAKLVDHAPSAGTWISEIKYDGYRAMVAIDGGRAKAYSRGGHDWTDKFAPIAEAAERLPVSSAILDGEVVAFDERGVSDFNLLHVALAQQPDRLVYACFDLLYLNGYDLRGTPLLARKELLAQVLADEPATGRIRFTEHVAGDEGDFYERACQVGLEGVVLKRADSTYSGSRSGAWRKHKCLLEQEFVVVGFTDPKGARDGFGALLLGYYDGEELRAAGRVGTGFDEAALASIHAKLTRLERKTSPLAEVPRGASARGVHWVTPKLVAQVSFAEWTPDGALRHPAFLGLREDKDPHEVVREDASAVDEASASAPAAQSAGDAGSAGSAQPAVASRSKRDPIVAGVTISHPDKLLFPDSSATKLDLASYYEAVAPWMLPLLAERPLTLLRCPTGGGQGCFWQRHPERGVSSAIRSYVFTWPGDDDAQEWLYVDSPEGLVSLAQMGVGEIHVWNSTVDVVGQPDRIVFDLDPGDGVEWPQIAESARIVKDALEHLGLDAYLKTTGGKGLHVVTPIEPVFDYERIRAFAKGMTDALVRAHPDGFVGRMAKAERGGKVFVDYLRNALGASAVAAYSTRSRAGAPVSVPLEWAELTDDLVQADFTMPRVIERVRAMTRDPWADIAERQASSRTLRAAFSAIS